MIGTPSAGTCYRKPRIVHLWLTSGTARKDDTAGRACVEPAKERIRRQKNKVIVGRYLQSECLPRKNITRGFRDQRLKLFGYQVSVVGNTVLSKRRQRGAIYPFEYPKPTEPRIRGNGTLKQDVADEVRIRQQPSTAGSEQTDAALHCHRYRTATRPVEQQDETTRADESGGWLHPADILNALPTRSLRARSTRGTFRVSADDVYCISAMTSNTDQSDGIMACPYSEDAPLHFLQHVSIPYGQLKA